MKNQKASDASGLYKGEALNNVAPATNSEEENSGSSVFLGRLRARISLLGEIRKWCEYSCAEDERSVREANALAAAHEHLHSATTHLETLERHLSKSGEKVLPLPHLAEALSESPSFPSEPRATESANGSKYVPIAETMRQVLFGVEPMAVLAHAQKGNQGEVPDGTLSTQAAIRNEKPLEPCFKDGPIEECADCIANGFVGPNEAKPRKLSVGLADVMAAMVGAAGAALHAGQEIDADGWRARQAVAKEVLDYVHEIRVTGRAHKTPRGDALEWVAGWLSDLLEEAKDQREKSKEKKTEGVPPRVLSIGLADVLVELMRAQPRPALEEMAEALREKARLEQEKREGVRLAADAMWAHDDVAVDFDAAEKWVHACGAFVVVAPVDLECPMCEASPNGGAR